MSTPLLPTRFLFRFSAACRYRDPLWTADGAGLDESYRLPSFAELEGRPVWAEVRAAWSDAGLAFTVVVQGKQQPPWCRESRPEDSDCLQIWIDTRDVHAVHRAGRFCHRFIFLAGGESTTKGMKPNDLKANKKIASAAFPTMAEPVPINRSREQPNPIRAGLLQARCQRQGNDYTLHALVPAEALTGFDPAEHPRLGFTYAVIDRELGQQTFGVGGPMPFPEDPSLWATLELQR
jgi:hypothetical protein